MEPVIDLQNDALFETISLEDCSHDWTSSEFRSLETRRNRDLQL